MSQVSQVDRYCYESAKLLQNQNHRQELQTHGLTRNASPVHLSYPQQPSERRPNPQFQLQYANPAQRIAAERQAAATEARGARPSLSNQAPGPVRATVAGQQAANGYSSSQRPRAPTRIIRTASDYASSGSINGETSRPRAEITRSEVW